jgi:hypothetical protein
MLHCVFVDAESQYRYRQKTTISFRAEINIITSITLAIRSPERLPRATSPSFLPASTAPPRLQREESPEEKKQEEEQEEEHLEQHGRGKRRRMGTISYRKVCEQGLT